MPYTTPTHVEDADPVDQVSGAGKVPCHTDVLVCGAWSQVEGSCREAKTGIFWLAWLSHILRHFDDDGCVADLHCRRDGIGHYIFTSNVLGKQHKSGELSIRWQNTGTIREGVVKSNKPPEKRPRYFEGGRNLLGMDEQ